jgi:ribonuclease HI
VELISDMVDGLFTMILNIDNVSNPTMELMAVAYTLKKFENTNIDLTIYSDYNGVQKWIKGEWKAKKPYIKYFVSMVHKSLETIDGNVNFEWIPGHSGVLGNEKADVLAKDRNVYENFSEFINNILK